MRVERRWTLWRVSNGWLAVPDRTTVPDGFEARAYAMGECSVHHSLRGFSDFLSLSESSAKKNNKK